MWICETQAWKILKQIANVPAKSIKSGNQKLEL